MSNILVTFGAVDQASADCQTIAAQIETRLGDLKSYLAPLRADWTGNASTDYQSLQDRWDRSAADLNAVLQQISVALRTAKDNYESAESANAGTWAV